MKQKTTSLTANEKKVLRLLVDNARITDAQIAKRIAVSAQASGKIRKKLEKTMIMQYRTVVSYERLGIKVFALAKARIEDEKAVLQQPCVMGAFRINEAGVTHQLILGFPDVEACDSFCQHTKAMSIVQVHVLSQKSFLKNTPDALVKSLLS